MTIHRVFLGVTFLASRAWLRSVSRGNRHFTVGGGRLRQSDPRSEARLLRQSALEGLTRSARTDSPRQVGRNKFRRERRRKAAAAFERRGGRPLGARHGRILLVKLAGTNSGERGGGRRRRLLRGEGGGHLELGLGFV
ncbi:hypothetical protein F511_13116 [Dorcoceras hygrometricum]|uniref:Uncharacterized protein n=1 Tax=Dorcoceras hygrometricum TaxID=472368 RepID=A0A2Z7D3X9_9LAMI|nr:hypothetical protein F511_13116 [Dorcoceras hygrometricum]